MKRRTLLKSLLGLVGLGAAKAVETDGVYVAAGKKNIYAVTTDGGQITSVRGTLRGKWVRFESPDNVQAIKFDENGNVHATKEAIQFWCRVNANGFKQG